MVKISFGQARYRLGVPRRDAVEGVYWWTRPLRSLRAEFADNIMTQLAYERHESVDELRETLTILADLMTGLLRISEAVVTTFLRSRRAI